MTLYFFNEIFLLHLEEKTFNIKCKFEQTFLAFFIHESGIDMCFGQPINNEILKLVQEEMTTLSNSVEENKESWMQDHEGLRNHLQNTTNLFVLDIKRLQDKQVTLERCFVRLQSRTDSLEEKMSGMSQAEDKHISTHNTSFASGEKT